LTEKPKHAIFFGNEPFASENFGSKVRTRGDPRWLLIHLRRSHCTGPGPEKP
jgi:hypothetical protein